MPKIRVLIADDHAVLRAGLKMLVNSQADMQVVAEAGTFNETIRKGAVVKPDVITLDLTMPDASGVEQIENVCRECPGAKVLVLTMHDDPAYLRAALSAGARGYVVKKAADTELLGAIRAVHSGRAFVDLDLHGATSESILVPAARAGEGEAGSTRDTLSERERSVLERLAQGYTNLAIAEQLDVSVKTVESYRGRLLRKLGLRTRADIIRYAVETGLLSRTDRQGRLQS
jgi:DNA-binding NarL/FixJ family response regulator